MTGALATRSSRRRSNSNNNHSGGGAKSARASAKLENKTNKIQFQTSTIASLTVLLRGTEPLPFDDDDDVAAADLRRCNALPSGGG